MKRIAHAILWSNAMIMVFDADGKQVEDLQGPVSEARRAAVLAAADEGTAFSHGNWNAKILVPVSKEMWAR